MKSLIGLGSNLGDRFSTLDQAVEKLDALPDVSVVQKSTWYESDPAGLTDSADRFANSVATVETTLEPHQLLRQLQAIEDELGRQRGARWEARTVDLDLLLCDQQIIYTPELEIPHPRMCFRDFVLRGAVEIEPDWFVPNQLLTIARLWENLNRIPKYIALRGDSALCAEMVATVARMDLNCRTALDPAVHQPSASYCEPSRRRELERVLVDLPEQQVLVTDFTVGWLAGVLADPELPSPNALELPEPTLMISVTGGETQTHGQLKAKPGVSGAFGALYELTGTDLDWNVRELRAAIETIGGC